MNLVTISFDDSLTIPLILLFIFMFILLFSSSVIIMYIKIIERQEEILRVYNNAYKVRLMEFSNSISSAIKDNSTKMSGFNHLKSFNPKKFLDELNDQISIIKTNIIEIFVDIKNHVNSNSQKCIDRISQGVTQGDQNHVVQESRLDNVEMQKLIESLGQSMILNFQKEFKEIKDFIRLSEQKNSQTFEIVSSISQSNQTTFTNILKSLQRLETHEGLSSLKGFDIGGKLQCIEDAIKSPYVEDPKQKEEVDRIVIETIKKLEERKRERESLANLF
jgi:hypothetical protein